MFLRTLGMMLICLALSAPHMLMSQTEAPFLDKNFRQALELAQAQMKPVVLFFHTEGCPDCERMRNEIAQDAATRSMLSGSYLALKMDGLDFFEGRQLAASFRVIAFPSVVVTDRFGVMRDKLDGFSNQAALRLFLQSTLRPEDQSTPSNETAALPAAIPSNPAAPAAQGNAYRVRPEATGDLADLDVQQTPSWGALRGEDNPPAAANTQPAAAPAISPGMYQGFLREYMQAQPAERAAVDPAWSDWPMPTAATQELEHAMLYGDYSYVDDQMRSGQNQTYSEPVSRQAGANTPPQSGAGSGSFLDMMMPTQDMPAALPASAAFRSMDPASSSTSRGINEYNGMPAAQPAPAFSATLLSVPGFAQYSPKQVQGAGYALVLLESSNMNEINTARGEVQALLPGNVWIYAKRSGGSTRFVLAAGLYNSEAEALQAASFLNVQYISVQNLAALN